MTRIRLSDNVVYRSFGSETVLLNLDTGHYHGLRGAGGRMLELRVSKRDDEGSSSGVGLIIEVMGRRSNAVLVSEDGTIMDALRRNPFLAIGLAVCAGLLVVEISRARRARILNGRSNANRAPLSPLDQDKESHDAG